jgi:pathogenesis-related protein 1
MRTKILTLLPIAVLAACSPASGPEPSAFPQVPPEVDRAPAKPLGAMPAAMLQAHNAVRRQVGVSPLMWSDRLAASAQAWADHLRSTRTFEHRPNNSYGENLFMIEGGSASPSDVVSDWAGEASAYDLRTNACTDVCGHYTQIVWSSTRLVGCAVAADQEEEVWACEYDPPGNYLGDRPY